MKKLLWIPMLAASCAASSEVQAIDLTGGIMSAVPIKDGKAPQINGDLTDWDLSATEPIWLSPQTIQDYRANVALMYDDDALYLGATVSLPNRGLKNPNNPSDAFWNGDVLEIRLAADPTLPVPLNRSVDSDRVAHITIWKNSETDKDFLNIAYGVNLKQGSKANPVGSQVVIKQHGTQFYTIETRIPWSALNVPDGKNPFKAGQKMTAVLSPHWGGETQTAALYRSNPGFFAFQQPQSWGQVEFSATGNLKPRHETMDQLLARFQAESQIKPVEVGVPIVVDVPAASKVSVNILGPNGEVIRELIGGEKHDKGKLTLRWDGKDQWGQPVKVGSYKWGAYFSGGLTAQFMGGVGKSGNVYYETPDGKGGWGADHSNPIDVAADASGIYFLWPVSEAGRAIVKTDYNGKVLWRKTPFVGGGFGPLYAIASDGKFLYLTLGDNKVRLVRLDATTGQLQTWGEGGPAELPVDTAPEAKVSGASTALGSTNIWGPKPIAQPQSVGIATNGHEVFIPIFANNLIRVLDVATGKELRTLNCKGPRGLTLSAAGDLFAVSYVEGNTAHVGQVVRFAQANGEGKAVVTQGLEAPWDVAVAANGRIFVSDLGSAQQVKVFSSNGKLTKKLGTSGGRAWQGKYDSKALLKPAGVTLDNEGGFIVAESSIPKVFKRYDAQSGKLLKEWFGSPVYWSSTWPSLDNPREVYTPLNEGIARYMLPEKGDQDRPEAYWALHEAGFPHASNYEAKMPQPEWVRANNGREYLVADGNPHTISLKVGDKLLPYANFRAVRGGSDENKNGPNFIEVWIDQNGDGLMAKDEPVRGQKPVNDVVRLETVEGKPLVVIGEMTDSMYMEPNGDLYFMTQANKILKIPALPVKTDERLNWDLEAATYIVPVVLPNKEGGISTTWRHGLHGARVDKSGNLYTIFNTQVGGQGGPFQYATPELAKRMKEGLGHTSSFDVTKFAKFDKNGKLLWMAGRKATAAAKAGEMYHFWNMAGLVNNEYIAGASEWGQIYFYTSDGFFVDALMNNPGLNPPPGPYTFGGETSGGRVQYFPKQDELWAYSTGKAFQVVGFKNGRVEGESRAAGTVELDKVYETTSTENATTTAPPLQIVPLVGDPIANATVWNEVPVARLKDLATAQIGYDAQYLYAKIRVNDASPLENDADTIASAFKGGDTAGIVLGPVGNREQPAAGDIRIMAAQVNGQPKLIAMKTVTNGVKQPNNYSTPAGGNVRFEFVGEVPNGKVQLRPDATGYTATFAVPRAFLEFDLGAGKELKGDVEVRLSGNGPRGLQVTSRNYLFTPATTSTTMTDDVPTESRMYPAGWGKVEVR